jgi:hypothetical protein
MRIPIDDPDLEIPEIDFSRVDLLPNRFARKPGEKTEICIDGAIGYSLRLIPSNKILARFRSTLEAWPEIIRTIEGGRSPRTLSLDWIGDDGRGGSISAGPRLEGFARLNNGDPNLYPRGAPGTDGRRVAERSDRTST